MKMRFEITGDSCYLFDYNTGTNITIEKAPFFMREKGPNLLDVSITNRCNKCCDFCYRKSTNVGQDIELEDYKLILDNAKDCGVQQIAIGGGEPTLHPQFCDILKLTRENGIIPNYSTNGENLTQDILYYTKKYCGAIAVSIYDDISEYEKLINKLVEYKIKINLHFILRADKIENYIHIIKNSPYWFEHINALIFLNYKPANGDDSLCFKNCPTDVICKFFDAVKSYTVCGVGFDTCSVPFICKYLDVNSSLYDYCESGRKSAYINEKLDVYPCSFYYSVGDSLKSNSLKNIWIESTNFIAHRKSLEFRNCKCEKIDVCRSGCPIYKISPCDECKT